jgi:hypothetical protein
LYKEKRLNWLIILMARALWLYYNIVYDNTGREHVQEESHKAIKEAGE